MLSHDDFQKMLYNVNREDRLSFCEQHHEIFQMPDPTSGTLLHRFVEAGLEEYISLSLKMGISIDAKNSHGQTALHLAALLDDGPLIDFLINTHHANKEAVDEYGMTPWLIACLSGADMSAEHLLAHQVNVDALCPGENENEPSEGSWEVFLLDPSLHKTLEYDDDWFCLFERLGKIYQTPERIDHLKTVLNDELYEETLQSYFSEPTAKLLAEIEQKELNQSTALISNPSTRSRL